jgi:hypothetical protein
MWPISVRLSSHRQCASGGAGQPDSSWLLLSWGDRTHSSSMLCVIAALSALGAFPVAKSAADRLGQGSVDWQLARR